MIYYSPISSTGSVILRIKTDACRGTDTEVRYLEHVQAVITANATRRGDLELFVTSPMGTRYWRYMIFFRVLLLRNFIFIFRSMILSRRANDDDHRDGFTKWPFMTTHTWGEYPKGTWLLEVSRLRLGYASYTFRVHICNSHYYVYD